MSRILTSSALLAACLGMAACGSSSSNTPNTNYLTALSGNFVFQEQVYTYYNEDAATHAPARMTAKPLHSVSSVGERTRAMAAKHFTKTNAATKGAHAVPAQGNVDSNVDWGAMIGSLQFDGQGNVIGGEIDYNEPTGGGYFADTVTGTYTIDSDNTGTISLLSNNVGAEFFFEIGLQGSTAGSLASGAQIVEGDEDGEGDIEIGTGTMLQQASSVSQSSINGNYVFGVQGQTCYGSPCPQANQGDLYAAGVVAADGAGTFGSGGEADVSDGFGSGNLSSVTGSYVAPDSFGRTTASLNTVGDASAGALPLDYVLYVANSSTFYILSTDNNNTDSGLSPYVFGTAGLQSGSPTLSGNYVLAESTEDLQNETTADTYSDSYLALLNANGTTFNGTGDSNKAGVVANTVPFNYGNYTVAGNGRVTLSGATPSGAPAPVFYLQSSGFGYGVDQLNGNSSLQEPGLISIYQQSGSSFSASSLSGLYALGTLPASTSLSGLAVGTVTSDGSSNLSGDVGVSSLASNSITSATATYTVAASGRGTATGSGDSVFGNAVFYIVSPSLTLAMDLTTDDTAPSIQILHQ